MSSTERFDRCPHCAGALVVGVQVKASGSPGMGSLAGKDGSALNAKPVSRGPGRPTLITNDDKARIRVEYAKATQHGGRVTQAWYMARAGEYGVDERLIRSIVARKDGT